MNLPKIISHRGYTERYPENTLIAFQEAQKLGADKIEFDVQMSKDGKLFIHHDYALGNPDNGKGFIYNSSSEYISGLKIGNYKIPSVDDVLSLFGDSIEYEIEMKGFTKEFIEKVLETINKHSLLEQIEFTSPLSYVLTTLKRLQSNAKVGMFIDQFPSWMDPELGRDLIKSNALLGNIDVLHCPLSILTTKFIKELHNEKLLVHAANCDTEEDLKDAIVLGVDQLSTNALALALKLLK